MKIEGGGSVRRYFLISLTVNYSVEPYNNKFNLLFSFLVDRVE